MTRTRMYAALLLLLASLWVIPSEAGPAGVIAGERFFFSKSPSWTHSGVWGPENNSLLLVDVLRDHIKVYTPSGSYRGILPKESNGQKFSNPTIIQKAAGRRFWLEDEDGRLLSLDSRFRILKAIELREHARGREGNLRAVYQWVPLEKDFLVFGDVRKGDHATSAFLRIPIDRPQDFAVLAKVGFDNPARRLYLLGMPDVAAVKGAPYYLVMDETPFVTTPNGNKLSLTITRDSKREPLQRPPLSEDWNRIPSREVFEKIEESTVPAGIYGWHDRLYILVRTPTTHGRTSWSLLKLDPRTGKTLWHRDIDSTANHMTVVPGDKYWAFIEKGKVIDSGQQEINSFLRVPAAELDR
jgi:hypothetical protein